MVQTVTFAILGRKIVEEVLRGALPGVRCAQGVTTEGAYREGGRVVPAGAGVAARPDDPGPGYEHTRHSLGWRWVDGLGRRA